MATIGTCGNCGGAVVTPDIWHGVHKPTPQCQSCHAIPAQPHGATIPMQRASDMKVNKNE